MVELNEDLETLLGGNLGNNSGGSLGVSFCINRGVNRGDGFEFRLNPLGG